MDMKTSPLAQLKDPTLLKTDGLIGGEWVKGSARFDVHDPATGQNWPTSPTSPPTMRSGPSRPPTRRGRSGARRPPRSAAC